MVKDKEHGESFNAQKLWDWLKPCNLKSKSWFLLCVCWVFWASKSDLVHIFQAFLYSLMGQAQALVQVRLSGLSSRSSSIGKDTKQSELITEGEPGSTKFRSFKILPLCSAAGLLTEVKKPWKCFEFQIDCILLNPSIKSVVLHLPPTMRPKEWQERCHFPPHLSKEQISGIC